MIELRESQINGTGVFATQDIPENIAIGKWCSKTYEVGGRYLYNEGMDCKWYETPMLGRYCNHSLTPNTSLVVNEDELILVSNGISKDEEILANYNWSTEHIGFIVDTTSID
jgi:hypothetical protein